MMAAATLDRSLSDADFRLFQKLFYEAIGLHLSAQKKMLVTGRLNKRLGQLGLPSFRAYYDLLAGDTGGEEMQQAIDLITTNETFFFRENKHFDILKKDIIPARPPGHTLKVWSAACSTGEEPYSIAMVLHQALGNSGWELQATDISTRVLQKARRGLYPMDRIDGIPPELLKTYCLRGRGEYEGMLLIDKALRDKVQFAQLNLMSIPADMRGFDLVFLRNVIIYFDNETKQRVLNTICDRLRPGGWLFLGHSESLAGMNVPLVAVSPSVYRRRAATAAS
ncbi:protein-glutamate O-methyltransferase [Permianibacter sp. IMCC34836]|uniref:CheR family methyltransferase n=1 Tax=Permianibacter fluminis TaxID=2738515 RepID=UPI0015554C6D|nr:protein-glutamate O-methyltransferase [Permianibacter fluminis]NQD36150.1 protein-glutamate O-methyltransferase [Permianibacter fluminis]